MSGPALTLTLSPGTTAAALRHAAHAAADQARHDRALAGIALAIKATAAITIAGAIITLYLQVLG